MTYLAFLRGINVGGHRVAMQELRRLFAELGLTRVRSYIQTGNIFFEAPAEDRAEDRARLTTRIEQHLQQALGYAVPVFLRTDDELAQLLALNPFRHLNVTADMRLCLMLLAGPAPALPELPLLAPKGDLEIIHLAGREAFVVWHLLAGRPPAASSTIWLDKLLGRQTTTRFFHTAQKILEAARQPA